MFVVVVSAMVVYTFIAQLGYEGLRGDTLRGDMTLADTFEQVVDSLPDDWTDLEFDLRIFDERRYVDAACARHLQRPAVLEVRLALAAAGRPPLRARGGSARRPRRR